jgi:hypothetical protein
VVGVRPRSQCVLSSGNGSKNIRSVFYHQTHRRRNWSRALCVPKNRREARRHHRCPELPWGRRHLHRSPDG